MMDTILAGCLRDLIAWYLAACPPGPDIYTYMRLIAILIYCHSPFIDIRKVSIINHHNGGQTVLTRDILRRGGRQTRLGWEQHLAKMWRRSSVLLMLERRGGIGEGSSGERNGGRLEGNIRGSERDFLSERLLWREKICVGLVLETVALGGLGRGNESRGCHTLLGKYMLAFLGLFLPAQLIERLKVVENVEKTTNSHRQDSSSPDSIS
jgi:hypothetical protein